MAERTSSLRSHAARRLTLAAAVALAALVLPAAAFAQVPKLDVRAYIGMNATTYVVRNPDLPTLEAEPRDRFLGWQGGVGARISRLHAFAAIDLVVERYVLRSAQNQVFDDGSSRLVAGDLQVNGVSIPITLGWIPWKSPLFKAYLYGGLDNRFTVRWLVERSNKSTRTAPRKADVAIYQIGARLGAAFDFAMFNLDANYTVGLNSATTTGYRSNLHQVQCNLGYVF